MLRKNKVLVATLTLAVAGIALTIDQASARRHPHLQKTVTTKVGDVETKLSYFTAPANMEHIENVKKGAFNPSFCTVEFSADITVGDATIAAGSYTVGAIMNGENDWSLALYPGRPARGQEPDMSKVIKLDSLFEKTEQGSAHIYFDIMPGHGSQEGKATLIWHYGNYYLSGTLS